MKSRTVRMTDELIIKIKSRARDGEHSVETVLRRLLQMNPVTVRKSVFETVKE